MRSGMLEAMALLGMETFYLEQIDTAPGLTARIVDQNPSLFSKEKVEDKLLESAPYP
jgi:hypothetical protein